MDKNENLRRPDTEDLDRNRQKSSIIQACISSRHRFEDPENVELFLCHQNNTKRTVNIDNIFAFF